MDDIVDDEYPEWVSSILNISSDIEDEGDRAYFGSTNDADDLKAIAEALKTAEIPEKYFKRPDFHRHNKELRDEITRLRAEVERLRELLWEAVDETEQEHGPMPDHAPHWTVRARAALQHKEVE